MAFSWGPVFQSIGEAGSQYSGARLGAAQYRIQQMLDQLKLQQGQQALKEGALSQQLEQERLRRLKLSPATETEKLEQAKQAFRSVFKRDPDENETKILMGFPQFAAPKDPLQQKVDTAERLLGRKLSPDELQVAAGLEGKPKEDKEDPLQIKINTLEKQLGRKLTKQELLTIGGIEAKEKPGGAAGAAPPGSMMQSLANMWANNGIKPPAKYQAAVEEYMEQHGMKPGVKLTAQEQRIFDLTKQIEPKIDQLKSLIEKNNLQDAGGPLDKFESWREWTVYSMGMKPEQLRSDLIKASAALRVMGAAPWMSIGRGKYLYEEVSKHLPNPSDSPGLLYDKAQFLKGIIDEARDSLPENAVGVGGERIPGAAPSGGATNAPPPGAKVRDYTQLGP